MMTKLIISWSVSFLFFQLVFWFWLSIRFLIDIIITLDDMQNIPVVLQNLQNTYHILMLLELSFVNYLTTWLHVIEFTGNLSSDDLQKRNSWTWYSIKSCIKKEKNLTPRNWPFWHWINLFLHTFCDCVVIVVFYRQIVYKEFEMPTISHT